MNATSLDDLRASAGRFFVAVLWLQVPLLLVVGWLGRGAGVVGLIGGILLAAAATAAWFRSQLAPGTRYMIAVAQVGLVSMMVGGAGGYWQIDLHMYYFASFAMLAAFCCWRTIVLAAGVTPSIIWCSTS
ncbi:MAG TPA: hypothetical protein VFO41_03705 [Alphaproteobacteria bacterium]|nr:hypothetical protein [Alphaproteobacteria bacterium]